MELWLAGLVYLGGMALILLEIVMPGMVMGFLGVAAMAVGAVYGFQHHWTIGAAQVALAVIVVPSVILYGTKRMALKADLSQREGGISFSHDYSALLGKEAETLTELMPGGKVELEGKKVDVVTGGEMVEKGRRVRVVKVEGNRIVVRAV